MSERPFRILSLDGGGSWAVLQAIALEDLCRDLAINPDSPEGAAALLRQFDLVVCNSGGSIVAACLFAGMGPTEIRRFFESEQRRRSCFVKLPWYSPASWLGSLLGVGPRYETSPKLAGLRAAIGPVADRPLRDLPGRLAPAARPTHLVIIALDYDLTRARYFRSNEASLSASRGGAPSSTTLAQAVHASSTAPINYFNEPAIFGGRRYWDGGVTGHNNPSVAGVCEALANGAVPGEIEVLSIGTATARLPVGDDPPLGRRPESANLKNDVRLISTSILADPPDAASYVAGLMIGGRPPGPADPLPATDWPLIRLNPMIEPVRTAAGWELPPGLNLDQFEKLAEMEMDAVEQKQVEQILHLGRVWLQGGVPNQGIRVGTDFRVEIGHGKYADAKRAWIDRVRAAP